MAEGVERIVTAGALMGRRYMCSKYYYAAVEEGCKERYTRGKCTTRSKKVQQLYKDGSKLLCGYRVTRGYERGCDPDFKSSPLFGKPLCTRWHTQKRKGGTRKQKGMTQRRKTQRRH